MPVTTPRKPSLSMASETAHESSRFRRDVKSFIWFVFPLLRGGDIHLCKPLLPIHKRHRVAGACLGAIARDVVDLVEPFALRDHRGNYGQPVLNFGYANSKVILR